MHGNYIASNLVFLHLGLNRKSETKMKEGEEEEE